MLYIPALQNYLEIPQPPMLVVLLDTKKNLESEIEGDACDKSMNSSPWLLVGVYTKRWHVLFQSGHIPR